MRLEHMYESIEPKQGPGLLLAALAVLITVALAVTVARAVAARRHDEEGGVVRPFLALVLVGGLVLLAGGSLAGLGSAQAGSLLVGGVVAGAASVATSYFAARGAPQIVIHAAPDTATVVPDGAAIHITVASPAGPAGAQRE